MRPFPWRARLPARTQLPFLEVEENAEPAYAENFGGASVERPTYATASHCAWGVGRLSVERCIRLIAWLASTRSADRILCPTRPKNITIKGLPHLASLLHLV